MTLRSKCINCQFFAISACGYVREILKGNDTGKFDAVHGCRDFKEERCLLLRENNKTAVFSVTKERKATDAKNN